MFSKPLPPLLSSILSLSLTHTQVCNQKQSLQCLGSGNPRQAGAEDVKTLTSNLGGLIDKHSAKDRRIPQQNGFHIACNRFSSALSKHQGHKLEMYPILHERGVLARDARSRPQTGTELWRSWRCFHARVLYMPAWRDGGEPLHLLVSWKRKHIINLRFPHHSPQFYFRHLLKNVKGKSWSEPSRPPKAEKTPQSNCIRVLDGSSATIMSI